MTVVRMRSTVQIAVDSDHIFVTWLRSDIRLKNNINKIGISESGLNIYTFSYLSEPGVTYQGVMAQDLIGSEFENAIALNSDGMYMVNYSLLDVEFKKIIQ